MRSRLLCAAGLIISLVLVTLGQVEIPLPEGAVMRLGLGEIKGNVVFSPDGRYLAVGTSLGIELRDSQTLELVGFFAGHTDWVNSVAFSPDGRILASGSYKGIKLWDAATGKELRTLSGHTYDVYSVAFSPDGKTLASGSNDWTIKLWDVATGRELRTLTGHTGNVHSVAFSPDGKTLASGSGDGTVLLWDVTFLIPQPPTIVRVTFPSAVRLGQEQNGIVRFTDPDGDIVRAEFTVVEGDPASIRVLPALAFDPEVRGMTSGAFRFTVVVTKAQTVVLRLVLVDSAGRRSDPVEFTFRVE